MHGRMRHAKIPQPVRPYLRWLAGLVLPGLLLLAAGVGALAVEYRTQWMAAAMGEYLLARNGDRVERGAIWQGILATRQSRSHLAEGPQSDSLRLEALPPGLLQCFYQAGPPAANRVSLRARARTAPLRLDQVDPEQMRGRARSLQLYRHGEQLLAAIELRREAFRAHARIQAEIALEDGALFARLHRALLAAGSPEGWNFVRMSPEDQEYWRAYLAPLLSPAEPDTASPSATVTDTTSALPRVCAGLLQAWEDSLYAADLRRLQQAWAGGEEMEIRLVRSMDRFTWYAVVGDDPPARFWLPAARVAAILGPHLLLGDEP